MVAPTELVVPTDYSRVHNTMAPEEDAAMEDADPENVSGASDDDSDSASEDDSDSGSDSDDGDEDVAMPDESATAKIMKLERRLESDPGDYGAHVQLCASLREWPSLRRRLRDAREAFAERFPLNETQWREWISDEVRATKGRRKRRGKVVGALFERAVADYQSVALWLGYAEFSLDQGWDVPARRSLYERALELAGLHFVDGHKIWAAYRAFELSKLELDAKNDPPAVAKQEETVRALLRRQLAVPHAQLDETLSACERWESSRTTKGATIDPAPVAKAKAEAAARQPLERALAAAEEKGDAHALAKAHGAYLDFELSSGGGGTAGGGGGGAAGSARARAAFERAVSATPTNAQLWRRYTDHLDHVVRVHTLSAAAHERACRNCPRDGETWAAWIRYHARHRLEELGAEDAGAGEKLDDVLKVYEECEEIMNRGVLSGPDTGDDALAIFLAQCHVVQRCPRHSALEERLGGRHVLTKARETLAEFYPGWVDRDMALPRLFADAFPAHGAKIWESYVRQGVEFGNDGPRGLDGEFKGGEYAGVAEAWIGYADHLFENASRSRGNENEDGPTPDAAAASSARAVFKSVYARANLVSAHGRESGQARLCRAWLDFELRRGDPVTYAAADARAGVVLRRLEAEDRERRLEGPDPEEAKRRRRANDPNYKGPKGPGDGARKRKADDDVDDHDGAGEDGAGSKRARTDADGEEKERRRGGGLGADPAERAAKYKEIFPDRDRKTAFVKNLPFKCSEDELAAWFDARGGTVTARIVKDKATGRSRGFAYVEFTEEGAVQAAIMRDGEEFQGRALSIARSIPPGENQTRGERREKAGGAPHRRVVGGGPAGGAARSGLGFAGGMKPRAVAIGGGMTPRAAKPAAAKPAAPKSNADFKAMFFQKGENLEEGK